MFGSQSAWFSTSVDGRTKQLWKDNGGSEADFDTAQFIFSADNTAADTLSVFDSTAYESEHLAVFHSRYINDCVRSGNRTKVILGRYFLPPQDIVTLVKKQMTLCWDIPPPHLPARPPQRPAGRNILVKPAPRPSSAPGGPPPAPPPSTVTQHSRTQASQSDRPGTSGSRPAASGTAQCDSRPQPARPGTSTNGSVSQQQTAGSNSRKAVVQSPPKPAAGDSEGRPGHRSGHRSAGSRTREDGPQTRLRGASESGGSRRDAHTQEASGRAEQRPHERQPRPASPPVCPHKRGARSPAATHSPAKRRTESAKFNTNTITTHINTTHTDSSASNTHRQLSTAHTNTNSDTTNKHHRQTSKTGTAEPTQNPVRGVGERLDSQVPVAGTVTNNSTTELTDRHRRGTGDHAVTTETPGSRNRVRGERAHIHGQARKVTSSGQGDQASGQQTGETGRCKSTADMAVRHISQLMKVKLSELSDFIPRTDGAEVYMKATVLSANDTEVCMKATAFSVK